MVAVPLATAPWGAGPARAQASAGIGGGAFLLLPVGARATALGQAATADGGTTEAVFWNPAGLASLAQGEFAIHHYDAFFGTGDALVIAAPTHLLGTLAFTGYLVNYGDLPVTRANLGPEPVGQISPRDIALMATYAAALGGFLAAGFTYKLAQGRVDCIGDCNGTATVAGTANAMDVGLRYADPSLPVELGADLRNLAFPLESRRRARADSLPTRVAAGVSVAVVRPSSGTPGLDARILADVQGTVGQGALDPVELVGVEAGAGELVRLRAGYAFLHSDARGPSLGFGVKFGSIAFDYATEFNASRSLGDVQPAQVSFRVIF
jgi:hypothetical protein